MTGDGDSLQIYMYANSLIRIGKLAKRLLARPHSQRYSSAVAVHLGAGVDWVFEPIQSVAESSRNGQRSGLQVGDLLNARVR